MSTTTITPSRRQRNPIQRRKSPTSKTDGYSTVPAQQRRWCSTPRESRSKHLRATHAGNRRVRNRLLPNENARQPRHLRHQPRRRGTQRYRRLLIRPLVHSRPFARRHTGSKLYISKHTDNWDGLILLSSYPTADLSKTKLRVLSAYGSKDDILNLKKSNPHASACRSSITDG